MAYVKQWTVMDGDGDTALAKASETVCVTVVDVVTEASKNVALSVNRICINEFFKT